MVRPTTTRRPHLSSSRLVAALGVATLLCACAVGPTEPAAATVARVRHDGTTPPPPPPPSDTAHVAGNYQGPLI